MAGSKAERNFRIAVVADDDDFFRLALSEILKKRLGFDEVIETASFDEAVDCLESKQQVSIALFDLAMPGMKGPAVLRQIREAYDVGCLVVVSGSRYRADILQSLNAGAHGFVSKADGPLELQKALQIILDGAIYVPPRLADIWSAPDDDVKTDPLAQADGDDDLRLTKRQRDVLELVVAGQSNKEIARSLNLGEGTVKVHLAALFRVIGVNSRSAAAAAGVKLLSQGNRGGRSS